MRTDMYRIMFRTLNCMSGLNHEAAMYYCTVYEYVRTQNYNDKNSSKSNNTALTHAFAKGRRPLVRTALTRTLGINSTARQRHADAHSGHKKKKKKKINYI